MYLTTKEIREFEDKIGYEIVSESNDRIGKFLLFDPKIKYSVSRNGSSCYSPSNIGNYFTDWQSQKRECDRWLKEQHERFPDGWVVKEGFETTKHEWFPFFHQDWNHLMEAIKRIRQRGGTIEISDIFETWSAVSQYCH